MNTKRILLVDDDSDLLFQMEVYVKQMGFEVETADSQKEGEEKLSQMKPDLCIFDLMMENKDSGFVLSYKAKKQNPDVPVIIVSGVTAETGMNFSLETDTDHNWMKADLFLEKNVRADQLHREISKLLKV
jgi:DNA-binding response OmpR family regulator